MQQRAPLHALLVSTSYITYEEAVSSFPHWMAAVARAFSQWNECWMTQDYPTFRERSRIWCLAPYRGGRRTDSTVAVAEPSAPADRRGCPPQERVHGPHSILHR